MLRPLKCSRRLSLLAAGLLGLAAPLVAVDRGTRPAPARTTRAAPGRVEELKVELAWMAEPETFRCPLRVRIGPQEAEVSGKVPSKKVRRLALEIAERAVSVPVF